MMEQITPKTDPTEQEIAACAYQLWQNEGCVHGRDVEYWFRAKNELNAARQQKRQIQTAAAPISLTPAPVAANQPPSRPAANPTSARPANAPVPSANIKREKTAEAKPAKKTTTGPARSASGKTSQSSGWTPPPRF